MVALVLNGRAADARRAANAAVTLGIEAATVLLLGDDSLLQALKALGRVLGLRLRNTALVTRDAGGRLGGVCSGPLVRA